MAGNTGNSILSMLLILILSTAPVAIILAIVFGSIRAAERRTQRLLAEGEHAEATVIDVRYTGVRINGNRQVAVELEVRRPGYPAYPATTKLLLNQRGSLFAPSNVYPPGTRLTVRVDPDKPQRVAIAGPIGSVAAHTFGSAQVFVVDGQSYQSQADLPAAAREALAQASAFLGDHNDDGIPDQFGATVRRSPAERLAELQRMRDQGLISSSEYDAKKAQIIAEL